MNDTEKYLFDLNGYIVVEGVLSADEVARCNEAIDRHVVRERSGNESLARGSTALKGVARRGEQRWRGRWSASQTYYCSTSRPTISIYRLSSGWK